MVTPVPAPDSRNWILWPIVFVGFYALWAAVFYPALAQPWWFADDFWMMEKLNARQNGEIYMLAHSAGRPVTALLFVLHHWAMDLQNPGGALAVRLLQGAGHCLTAVLLARLFSRYISLGQAILCALLFLLWGFSAESVVWFGGIQHVFGALFAVGGYVLIHSGVERRQWWRCLLGGGLCTAAMLSNQNPAGAALLLWLMVLVFRQLSEKSQAYGMAVVVDPRAKRGKVGFTFEKLGRWLDVNLAQPLLGGFLREGFHLFWGLGTGAVVTLLMVNHYSYSRAQGVVDWLGKLKFIGQLNNYTFFWPEFYPAVLTWTVGVLVFLVATNWPYSRVRNRDYWMMMGTIVLFLAAGMVLPYFANLIIPMNWPSFRILYIGPMFVAMLGALAYIFTYVTRVLKAIVTVTLVIISYHYAWIGWHNAANYPRLYQEDLATLRQLESFAKEKGVNHVLVLSGANSPWPYEENPYGIRYAHLDAFRSNFHTPWTGHPFIRLHSKTLIAEGDEFTNKERIKSYFAFASAIPRGKPSFRFAIAPDDPGLILVIPR